MGLFPLGNRFLVDTVEKIHEPGRAVRLRAIILPAGVHTVFVDGGGYFRRLPRQVRRRAEDDCRKGLGKGHAEKAVPGRILSLLFLLCVCHAPKLQEGRKKDFKFA